MSLREKGKGIFGRGEGWAWNNKVYRENILLKQHEILKKP